MDADVEVGLQKSGSPLSADRNAESGVRKHLPTTTNYIPINYNINGNELTSMSSSNFSLGLDFIIIYSHTTMAKVLRIARSSICLTTSARGSRPIFLL